MIRRKAICWLDSIKQINFSLSCSSSSDGFDLTKARHEINESVEASVHDFGAGMSEIPFDSTRASPSASNEYLACTSSSSRD